MSQVIADGLQQSNKQIIDQQIKGDSYHYIYN